MANLLGATREETHLVTSEVAIDFLGNEQARVLSTPNLVYFLEYASRNCIQPLLEPGQDTVGSTVNIRHLAATPIGMSVRFRAEVIAVDDRRVMFQVEAFDEKEQVAAGTHERFIINIAKFAARVAAKAAGQ